MDISVIIPVYNEARHLKECLGSLRRQSTKPKEIIIVDDGSTDPTINILETEKNIILLKQHHQGPAKARNKGAKRAQGDILVFVDADMTFDQAFLFQLTRPIKARKTNGTFTKEEFVANWDNPWARSWNYETAGEGKRRIPQNYPNQAPVFRAILKSEFDRISGFDPVGYTDDWTLAKKLGYQAQVAKGAIIYHYNPNSLVDVFRQAQWIGKRHYKFGEFGRIIALIRALPIISVPVGLFKSLKYQEKYFLVFKCVYDFGITTGILSYWLGRGHAK